MEMEQLPPPWDDDESEEALEFYDDEDEEDDSDTVTWYSITDVVQEGKTHIAHFKQAFITHVKNRMSVLYLNAVKHNEVYIAASSRKKQYGFRSGNLAVLGVRPSEKLQKSVAWLVQTLYLTRCTGVYSIDIKELYVFLNKIPTKKDVPFELYIGKTKTSVLMGYQKKRDACKKVAQYVTSNSILTDIEYIVTFFKEKVWIPGYTEVSLTNTELTSDASIVTFQYEYPDSTRATHHWIEGLDIFNVKSIKKLDTCMYRYLQKDQVSYVTSYLYGKDELGEYYLLRPYSVFFLV